MKLINKKLPLYVMASFLFTTPAHVMAEEEIPFDEAQLFFELNNTDGDLGIHGKVDGDEWKLLKIEDPYERRMMKVRINGRLKRQGLTELFFESAEPTFDELDPADFFNRFPEGTYEIEGITLDNEERENEVELSHVLPAPAENVTINGIQAAEDCDAVLPVVTAPVTISWDAVTSNHPELGKAGIIEVDYYEIVVENEELELVMSTQLPGNVPTTSLSIPDGYIALGEEFKFEILTRAENGNKTAIESCFVVE